MVDVSRRLWMRGQGRMGFRHLARRVCFDLWRSGGGGVVVVVGGAVFMSGR